MSEDERTAREAAAPEDGRDDRPYGAIAVTGFLAAVIVGFWVLVFVLTQLRG